MAIPASLIGAASFEADAGHVRALIDGKSWLEEHELGMTDRALYFPRRCRKALISFIFPLDDM